MLFSFFFRLLLYSFLLPLNGCMLYFTIPLQKCVIVGYMEINSFYNLYANTYITNFILVIGITGLTIALAWIMPIIDERVCKKAGVNLWGGVSDSLKADSFLKGRKILLNSVFLIYLAVLIYLVFIGRPPHEEYLINNSIGKFADLKLIDLLFPRTEFLEFYLNTMLFLPMGYLLPYLFRWFRMRPIRRTLLFCFVLSLLIENFQLLTKRGYYDTSDLLANTLGSGFGIILFLMRAYRLTDPDWKKNRHNYRRWKKRAKDGTLFPFVHRTTLVRTTIRATNEEEIWSFYVEKMGLPLRRQLVPENSDETSFLFEIGRTQIEIICSNHEEELPEQTLMIAYENLDRVRRRLLERGIDPGAYLADPYTGRRMLSFRGAGNVLITMLEY